MDCNDVRMLLDAYIDGELSLEQARALNEHAKACSACAEELRAAELVRDALNHMDDDISVPLPAQAAWRNAVRAEAKKKNTRKWLRGAYAAAAALILVLGVNMFMGGEMEQPMIIAAENAPVQASIIERDGASEIAVIDSQDATVRKKISVSDMQAALESIRMLAAEYSGSCSQQAEDLCYVQIPYEYLQDFLKSASRIGDELLTEVSEENGDIACIQIQFVKQ